MPRIDEFFAPTLDRFSPELGTAITEAPMPGLGAGPPAAELARLLGRPTALRLATNEGGNAPLPPLAMSGLWLLAGELDRSHTISQDDSSPAGSFWHGIMHRREGDYSNTAYWFRRVGGHAVLDELARRYPDDHRDAYQFINAVEAACRQQDAERIANLEQIQWTEWQLLLQDCLPA
ncbi:hypothetical protein CA85_38250 [Allorhodopirellula solitaria]|uniref:Uncharacterized protein n=2 Tax=Allorhodopirellula solitaria TaxID=2527987 RepID=A0A5C5XSM3_9BACT|nr:hypothetical protein CA85_38250 [Allorhodopirellula solitaria]